MQELERGAYLAQKLAGQLVNFLEKKERLPEQQLERFSGLIEGGLGGYVYGCDTE